MTIDVENYYKERIKFIKEQNTYDITFGIVQVGDNEASNRYVRNKIKDCEKVNIKTKLIKLNEDITPQELLQVINDLNNDNTISSYIVQMPLPNSIDEEIITSAISIDKDADGLTPLSKVNPATPQGIIDYLYYHNYKFKNKNAVIIGRSDLVGKPMVRLLLDEDCNVKIAHSKTSKDNLHLMLDKADLIICATGHRDTLTEDDLLEMKVKGRAVNDDCILFDVGINFTSEGKLVGDCENINTIMKTPVPKGVGLLTRLALLQNIVNLEVTKYQ